MPMKLSNKHICNYLHNLCATRLNDQLRVECLKVQNYTINTMNTVQTFSCYIKYSSKYKGKNSPRFYISYVLLRITYHVYVLHMYSK